MALELDSEAGELFCSIVTANVNEAARISNFLIDSEKRQTRYFAKSLIDLYEAIERIPDFMRSVYIDDCLGRAGVAVNAAYTTITDDPA